jgi:predicted RNase H-like HicB family nuclease
MKVQVKFTMPVEIRKKGRWFIALCPALDVVTQGETEEKAKSNLVDALVEFLLSCWDRGTLDQVMKDAGFVPSEDGPRWAAKVCDDMDSVEVPLPFIIADRLHRAPAEAR